MDSAVFLALLALLQIIATHRTLGEIDDTMTERRLGVYRRRVVSSLSKIVFKKIPFASGVELGRAMDSYTCGNCYLSNKVTSDSKCIKACTRIMRFSNTSPPNSDTDECDVCVATAVNRSNRECEGTCTVRQLTSIMASVVSEAVSFRVKALLRASMEHQGNNEPIQEELKIDKEPAKMRFAGRKIETSEETIIMSNSETLNHKNDQVSQRDTTESDRNDLKSKSGTSDYLRAFRIHSDDEAAITDISGKVDEGFLNGSEGGGYDDFDVGSQPASRSGKYPGRFVHSRSRTGSAPGSSHRLLNNYDRYKNSINFKNFIKANNFFHPDNTFDSDGSLANDMSGSEISNTFGSEKSMSADEGSTDNLETIAKNLEQETRTNNLEQETRSKNLAHETRTKSLELSDDNTSEVSNDDRQKSRYGGGFSLRDALSESVADLSRRQQARITKSLKKLGSHRQSSRGSVGFNRRANSDGAKGSDYDQGAGDLSRRQRKRISNAFRVLLSNYPADAFEDAVPEEGGSGGPGFDTRSGSLRYRRPTSREYEDYYDEDYYNIQNYVAGLYGYGEEARRGGQAYHLPRWRLLHEDHPHDYEDENWAAL